jgi:hypothetical protein
MGISIVWLQFDGCTTFFNGGIQIADSKKGSG